MRATPSTPSTPTTPYSPATPFTITDRLVSPGARPRPPLEGERRPDATAERRHGERERREQFLRLKAQVQRWLIKSVNAGLDLEPTGSTAELELRRRIDVYLDRLVAQGGTPISRAERVRLHESVLADLLAYGPIEPLLHDDTVSEVMVNGPDQVWVERGGRIEETDVRFEDEEHVRRTIERIVSPLGRRIDESSPMVDARLPDGSRVNAVIPPLSLIGPVLTIRKFARAPLTVARLVEVGALTQRVANFLAACVRGRANILISGGTGSGKTTLLNVLSSFIPDHERIVTIEDAAELQLRQRHVVPLEARPPNAEGAGAVPIRSLLINALRMRPDRIVIGECRGGEALDMLQAMNTGHDGSMATLHANTPQDAVARLETLVLLAGTVLPHRAVREQIASAVDLVVQLERLRDGSRRVVEVAEVAGMDGDTVALTTLFHFQAAAGQSASTAGAPSAAVATLGEDERVEGALRATGAYPRLAGKLLRRGVGVSPAWFGVEG
jgi:pilus assembly protein CpaF